MKIFPGIIKKYDPVIICLAVFSIFFHLIFIKNLEYHRDELLYFSLGSHPDFGYDTVPPLIGWIAWIMQNIFGFSIFSVRLFPAIMSGVMVFLIASIAKELGGTRYASFIAALGLIVSSFFLRSFFLFQPVHMEILFWTLCIYLIIKYINTSKDKFLIIFGITAGFALLNKLLTGLLFVGLLIIIPFTRYRTIFRNRFFWIGILAGFIIFLPNLIWQAVNGFPVFGHITELYDTQLVHMDAGLFLTEQLLMPCAGTILTMTGLIFLLTSNKVGKYRFLGLLALFVIISLMLLKGKSYYTLGVFPLMIASGAVAFDHLLKKTWLKVLLPVVLVLLTIPVLPMGLPVFKHEGLIKYFKVLGDRYGIDAGRQFEDGSIHSLPQDYADMIGWEELTSLTDVAFQMIPDKKASFIYCENYGQAGAITIIGKKYGLPEAVSFHESFRYWIPEQFTPDIKYFIYINDELGEDINLLFQKITEIGKISDPDAREYGTTVYLCENPCSSFNEFWVERLKRLDE